MHLVSLFSNCKQNTMYTIEMDRGKNILLFLNFEPHFHYLFSKSLFQERKDHSGFWNCFKKFDWKTELCEKLKLFSSYFITWTLDKRPLIMLFFRTETGVKDHLVIVHSKMLHWSPWRPFNAVPSSSITRIIAPSASRLLQTLSTGSQARTILSCMTEALTNMLHDFIFEKNCKWMEK